MKPRKTNNTPVSPITVAPATAVKSVSGRTAQLSIFDPTSSTKRRKIAQAVSAYVYSFVGAEYPTDPALWEFCGSATRDVFSVTFGDEVAAGAQVWLCAAWCSRRGDTGPVSMPVTTRLQFGGVSANEEGMKIAA